MNPVRRSQIWQTKPVNCSNDCATIQSYTILLLESSYGNIPSCSWPNHSSDVVKWSSRVRVWIKEGYWVKHRAVLRWIINNDLTFWHPLLPYGYSYKTAICNVWHPGTLTLLPQCQSARMSKTTNDDNLVRHRELYSGCIHMATVGVKGLRSLVSLLRISLLFPYIHWPCSLHLQSYQQSSSSGRHH